MASCGNDDRRHRRRELRQHRRWPLAGHRSDKNCRRHRQGASTLQRGPWMTTQTSCYIWPWQPSFCNTSWLRPVSTQISWARGASSSAEERWHYGNRCPCRLGAESFGLRCTSRLHILRKWRLCKRWGRRCNLVCGISHWRSVCCISQPGSACAPPACIWLHRHQHDLAHLCLRRH